VGEHEEARRKGQACQPGKCLERERMLRAATSTLTRPSAAAHGWSRKGRGQANVASSSPATSDSPPRQHTTYAQSQRRGDRPGASEDEEHEQEPDDARGQGALYALRRADAGATPVFVRRAPFAYLNVDGPVVAGLH